MSSGSNAPGTTIENAKTWGPIIPYTNGTDNIGSSTNPYNVVYCNSVQSAIQPVVVLSGSVAAQSIAASNSGSIIFVPQCTANVTVTMPAVKAGFRARVIVQATSDGTHTCTFAFPANTLHGAIVGTAAGLTATDVSGQTNLVLSATAANVKAGDNFDIYCDGTTYFAYAFSHGTASGWSSS